jgi:hypothetical protein
MRRWVKPLSEVDEELMRKMHENALDAHNFISFHRKTIQVGVWGRYYLIRAMHHIHGLHTEFKLIDFWYALMVVNR